MSAFFSKADAKMKDLDSVSMSAFGHKQTFAYYRSACIKRGYVAFTPGFSEKHLQNSCQAVNAMFPINDPCRESRVGCAKQIRGLQASSIECAKDH